MARMPRIVVPGQAMHIIQRGNNRQATFFADDDYLYYLDTLQVLAHEYACSIHAYILMTNHIHLLATPAHENSISLLMQGIGRKYVRYINHTYQRSGTLWEGRFKSALIDSGHYLLACSRYIELNPVRAGMVKIPEQYRWSSYHANALGQGDFCITSHRLYKRLGENYTKRIQAYRALFKNSIGEDALTLIRKNTQQGTIIGDSQFQEEIRDMLKRRVMKHEHGGDRKAYSYNKLSSVLTP